MSQSHHKHQCTDCPAAFNCDDPACPTTQHGSSFHGQDRLCVTCVTWPKRSCEACDGKGFVEEDVANGGEVGQERVDCDACKGRGWFNLTAAEVHALEEAERLKADLKAIGGVRNVRLGDPIVFGGVEIGEAVADAPPNVALELARSTTEQIARRLEAKAKELLAKGNKIEDLRHVVKDGREDIVLVDDPVLAPLSAEQRRAVADWYERASPLVAAAKVAVDSAEHVSAREVGPDDPTDPGFRPPLRVVAPRVRPIQRLSAEGIYVDTAWESLVAGDIVRFTEPDCDFTKSQKWRVDEVTADGFIGTSLDDLAGELTATLVDDNLRVVNLKTAAGPFQATWDGDKPFEVRFNDRAFTVGDVLNLREVDGAGQYTGRLVVAKVHYVGRNDPAIGFEGYAPGFVGLGLVVLNKLEGVPAFQVHAR